MRTALIDGDTVIFAASSATEEEAQFDEWTWILWGNLSEAIARFDNQIRRIEEEIGADRVIIALSHRLRFRPDVMPDYKNNRRDSRKPITYKPLRQYVRDNYDFYEKPYLEGDDVLGILATHPKVITGEKVIVAIDKDLNTIPGLHYNYDTEDFYEVSQVEADRFFIQQTLMGDRTDGYTGCPGIGPKTSEKVLRAAEEELEANGEEITDHNLWPFVVETYESKGCSEEDALMNARVARICRCDDYDYKKEEVILWTP